MERSAFVLRHFEEQSIVVIAAALDVTANTARQTIFRAVSKLRRQFAPVTPASSTTLSPSRFARES
jgi:RNA polymerase sigma-70 factor (ECF subfamily)